MKYVFLFRACIIQTEKALSIPRKNKQTDKQTCFPIRKNHCLNTFNYRCDAMTTIRATLNTEVGRSGGWVIKVFRGAHE